MRTDNINNLKSQVAKIARRGLMSLCFSMAVVTMCLLGSCSDGSCYDNSSAVPLAWFYQSGTSTQLLVSNLTVSAIGAPGDTLLIDDESASDIHLPLRATVNSTKWCFEFMAADSTIVADTITIDYRPIEYFASVECGAMFYFDINHVTTTQNIIDSVVVVQPHVSHVEQVNLRIYLPNE